MPVQKGNRWVAPLRRRRFWESMPTALAPPLLVRPRTARPQEDPLEKWVCENRPRLTLPYVCNALRVHNAPHVVTIGRRSTSGTGTGLHRAVAYLPPPIAVGPGADGRDYDRNSGSWAAGMGSQGRSVPRGPTTPRLFLKAPSREASDAHASLCPLTATTHHTHP